MNFSFVRFEKICSIQHLLGGGIVFPRWQFDNFPVDFYVKYICNLDLSIFILYQNQAFQKPYNMLFISSKKLFSFRIFGKLRNHFLLNH